MSFLRASTFILLYPLLGSLASAETALEKIHQEIVRDYEAVEHLELSEFASMPADDMVTFDVREENEFLVSHIEGAIQLDPDTTAADFERLYADQIEGKTVVFYCSVGRRSSELAARVDEVVKSSSARASFNLAGGVFSWRNQRRALVSAPSQATTKIHPYNFYWGRLIDDKKAISYSPE